MESRDIGAPFSASEIAARRLGSGMWTFWATRGVDRRRSMMEIWRVIRLS